MKLLMRIVAGIAVFAAMAWDLYDWIYIDQGPAYFAADWRRIALVVVLSLGGGLIAFLFMRLPAIVRQRVTTGVFGVCVLLTTMVCAYVAYVGWRFGFLKPRVFPGEENEQLMLWLFVLGFIALTTFIWFLFLKYWRRICGPKAEA